MTLGFWDVGIMNVIIAVLLFGTSPADCQARPSLMTSPQMRPRNLRGALIQISMPEPAQSLAGA